jgi:hypothetical protein
MLSYAMIPPMASRMPTKLPSLRDLPLVIQPVATIRQVFEWPTTVLLTGPASLMMRNCERLMRQASMPLYQTALVTSSKYEMRHNLPATLASR